MKKKQIYLETSFINNSVENQTPEFHSTSQEFMQDYLPNLQCCDSSNVTQEILRCKEPKRSKMLNLLDELDSVMLEPCVEVIDLANEYVSEGVFPQKHFIDAMHVAYPSVYSIEYLVSFDKEHIVRKKTILGIEIINRRLGYSTPVIGMPKELMAYERQEHR